MINHVSDSSNYLDQPVVLFQDDDLAVISKPPGWVVNRASTHQEPTVQDWAVSTFQLSNAAFPANWPDQVPAEFDDAYGQPAELFAQRDGMVHRLDKDTSGVMLWAKHPGSLVHLLHQFKHRLVSKEYRCLVHGKFSLESDLVRLPIARDPGNRQRFLAQADGRPAETKYKVLGFYSGLKWQNITEGREKEGLSKVTNLKKRVQIYQGFSEVACWPKTGRTHQIRVHMKALRHPLVGDTTYTGRKRAQLDPIWCPRQFLHAAQLSFTHPRTGQTESHQADLWPDLEKSLTYLEK